MRCLKILIFTRISLIHLILKLSYAMTSPWMVLRGLKYLILLEKKSVHWFRKINQLVLIRLPGTVEKIMGN